jgi:hypothetical protein
MIEGFDSLSTPKLNEWAAGWGERFSDGISSQR